MEEDLFEKVQAVADEEQTTVVEIFRKFTKFGLIALEVQKKPDAALIIREGDTEREIIFL